MALRLLNVQYAGDYAEAWRRFKEGGPEYYGGQRRSVLGMGDLREFASEVTTFTCTTARRFDEILEPGLRAVGAGFTDRIDWTQVLRWVREYDPDVMIASSVSEPLLRPTLCPQARHLALVVSTLKNSGPWQCVKNRIIGAYLNQGHFEWVGCNNLAASRFWIDAGVVPTKIVPFSIESENSPDQNAPKQLEVDGREWQLLFVGSVIEGKGVGDAIRAVAILRAQGRPVRLRIVGRGDVARYQQQANELGVTSAVDFGDLEPLSGLVATMRAADCILVPSRHSYTEGSPLVLLDALCSRTPVVLSDHQVFRASIREGEWGLMFRAGDAAALASRVVDLLTNPTLYAALSRECAKAWENILVPVLATDLRYRWVRNSPEDRAWLSANSYASGIYAHRFH